MPIYSYEVLTIKSAIEFSYPELDESGVYAMIYYIVGLGADATSFAHRLIQMDVDVESTMKLSSMLFDSVGVALNSDIYKKNIANHYCKEAIDELIWEAGLNG